MPELPEIETARNRLQKVLKGHKIVKVIVDKDDFVCYDQAEPLEVRKALKGATVTGTGRKGKYFWLKLDRKPWVMLHFGMTGNLEIRRKKKEREFGWGGPVAWRAKTEPESEGLPRFCRLFLVLENGDEIAITDPRRFGRIRLYDDPEQIPTIQNLGYDPLQKFPSTKVLFEKLHKRRVAIKAVLLDQKVFAGVGNWIADEVLYQSGIAPHRLATSLSLLEVSKLRQKLMAIIRTSVRLDADYDLYPKNWLFHYRWGKTKNAKDSRGREMLHETVGGRTSAWVPRAQS